MGFLEHLAAVLLVDARRHARLHLDAVYGLVKGVSAAWLGLMHPICSLVERARHGMAHLVGAQRVDKLGELLVGINAVECSFQRVAGISVGHERLGRRLKKLDGSCCGGILHMKHALGDARVYGRAVLFGRPGCSVPGASLRIPYRPAPVGIAVESNRLARPETVGRLQLEESIARLLRGVLKRDGRRTLRGGNRAVVDGPVGGAVGARKPPGYLLGKLGPGTRRRVVGLFLAHGQAREGIPSRDHQVLHPAIVVAVARGGRIHQAGSGVIVCPRGRIGVGGVHERANLLVVVRIGAVGEAVGVGERPHGILGDIHALVSRAVGMGHDVFELRQDTAQVHARDGGGVPRRSLRKGCLGPLARLGTCARSRAA